MIWNIWSAMEGVKWLTQSPTTPFLNKFLFSKYPMDLPVWFTSKFFKFSKLHSLDISSATPSLSSSKEKGTPRKFANLFNWKTGSSLVSSYFMNNILLGGSRLSFQYSNICFQKGPNAIAPLQYISKPSSMEMGPRVSGLTFIRKCQDDTKVSRGFRHQ